jgi:hypothetical protein
MRVAVRADVSAVLVLFLLAALWRRVGDRFRYTLRELLPSGRSWAVLAGFLAFGYLWQTALIHPEFLPRRLGPHLTILGLYALFGGLLVASVLGAGPFVKTGPSPLKAVAWQAGLVFLVVFPAVMALFVSLRDRTGVFVLLATWTSGPLIGLAVLVAAVVGAVRFVIGRRPEQVAA